MLDLVVGGLAALLVVAGAVIIAGPVLPRFWHAAWSRLRPVANVRLPRASLPINQPTTTGEPALHPTTMRALTAAARAYSLLRANGEEQVALELRSAARQVRSDEAQGLLALVAVLRSLRVTTLDDAAAEGRFRKLVNELRDAVRDRSEQLELLHFR